MSEPRYADVDPGTFMQHYQESTVRPPAPQRAQPIIRALPTEYKGITFRSRREARWAVFFDALKLPWVYEAEGYDLGPVGYYLPDFHVTLRHRTCWIEIKGPKPNENERRCAAALAMGTGESVYIFAFDPWEVHNHDRVTCQTSQAQAYLGNTYYPDAWDGHSTYNGYTFCQCRSCWVVGIERHDQDVCPCGTKLPNQQYTFDSLVLVMAAKAAWKKRFYNPKAV